MSFDKMKNRWHALNVPYYTSREGNEAATALWHDVKKLIAVAEAAKEALPCCDPMFRVTERLEQALVELEKE